MRKRFICSFCAFLALIITLSGCAPGLPAVPRTGGPRALFTRDIDAVDFGKIEYNPWDSDAAVETAGISEPKAYTIMVYMNGSDLESVNGEATKDLREMLSSGVDTERFNIIIFTGGTRRWRTEAIPADDCVIWRLAKNGLERITGVGLRDMGDSGTLSSFIRFGMTAFPAEKYGLILWDHGGGSIAGFGHDELFDKSRMSLLELDYAFNRAGLGETKLEFIGFDACLMATVETAVVAARYARYFTASQDLEPGDGWDYVFLGVLNDNPDLSGAQIGRAIADTYMDFYGPGSIENLTMSVTDLSRVKSVMGAMGELMGRCTDSLNADRDNAFPPLARRRHRTKTFGAGSRRSNDCDLVDLADMNRRLRDVFPEETHKLQTALTDAVLYNRHNLLTDVGGLAAYYIFGGKADAHNTLGVYSSLNMSADYTVFLKTFAGILEDAPDMPPEERWAIIGDERVRLYKIGENVCADEYAAPVQVNGEDADLIVTFCEYAPDGIIRGYRLCNGYMRPKGVMAIDNVQLIIDN